VFFFELEEVEEIKILYSLYLLTSKPFLARLYEFYWHALWVFPALKNY
tara:strand:- start:3858 stop:4001 length:144 start_codon:yes stop_codon:yes gene_type:complete